MIKTGPTVLEAFAGIGGMTLGLERAGMHCVGLIEKDPFCRRILARHWPEVPQHDEIKTAVTWWRTGERPTVDVVAGGYPCQPESNAGKRQGERDPRWLWPWLADLIEDIRPRAVICENVMGHRTSGLRVVLTDLARLGYRARSGAVRACEVGAPHARARLFIVAHANRLDGPAWLGIEQGRSPVPVRRGGAGAWRHLPRGLAPVSGNHGVADGVPRRVDRHEPARVKALGNAVVPQVAEHIGRMVVAALDGPR